MLTFKCLTLCPCSSSQCGGSRCSGSRLGSRPRSHHLSLTSHITSRSHHRHAAQLGGDGAGHAVARQVVLLQPGHAGGGAGRQRAAQAVHLRGGRGGISREGRRVGCRGRRACLPARCRSCRVERPSAVHTGRPWCSPPWQVGQPEALLHALCMFLLPAPQHPPSCPTPSGAPTAGTGGHAAPAQSPPAGQKVRTGSQQGVATGCSGSATRKSAGSAAAGASACTCAVLGCAAAQQCSYPGSESPPDGPCERSPPQ